MRQIGTLPKQVDPGVFLDHLTTLGMKSRVDDRPDGWAVWVYNEDHIAQARRELDEYLKAPDDPRYHVARRSAQAIRRESEKRDREFRKNFRPMSGRWDRPNLHRRPLTAALVGISIAVYVASETPLGIEIHRWLTFFPDERGHVHGGGLANVLHGQFWRVLTPIFLHYNVIHILFNMWALWVLGTLIEYRRGTATMALLVFVSAIASNMGQFAFNLLVMHRIVQFGGMSGVVYALFGYVWMKGRYEPEQGMILHPRSVQMMLFWLVLCFTGRAGPIANAAHVVGLVAGMFFGLSPL